MKNTAAIVLAAGKGTRIGQTLPKALYPIAGRPMLHYTLDTLNRIPIPTLVAVVGFRGSDVKASIGKNVHYVYQSEQLGTAHAVKLALPTLLPSINTILVVNCDDSAFYEASTLRAFIQYHHQHHSPISLISSTVSDPTGLGRLIRNSEGKLVKVVEENEASKTEKDISEINTGCYLFDVSWIRENINSVEQSPKGEYYITKLIEIALEKQREIAVFPLSHPNEYQQVNTKAQLATAHKAMVNKLQKINTNTTVIIDIDNTILDTQQLKHDVINHLQTKLSVAFGYQIHESELSEIFWQIYEANRQEAGYINLPTVWELMTQKLDLSSAEPIKDMFFSLPFKSYIKPGTKELLEFLKRWSQVVVFGDGDMVYEPVKLAGLNLHQYYHDFYISETKKEFIPDLLSIYQDEHIIVIDDQINNLIDFNQAASSPLTTIHLKNGPYQDQKPKKSFVPNFEASSLEQVLEVAQGNIFTWT